METGTTADIFANPLHPYTEALFSAIPVSYTHLDVYKRQVYGNPELTPKERRDAWNKLEQEYLSLIHIS